MNSVSALAQAPGGHPKTDFEGSNFCAFAHGDGLESPRVIRYPTTRCAGRSGAEAKSEPHVALTEPGIAFCGRARPRRTGPGAGAS
jgi:hypothetical protein